jgi:hypothetical protein
MSEINQHFETNERTKTRHEMFKLVEIGMHL